MMWANDFPHSDSTWPWSQEMLAEQDSDIDGHAPGFDGIEILGESLEGPVHAQAIVQGGNAHALDLFQRAHDELTVFGPLVGGR